MYIASIYEKDHVRLDPNGTILTIEPQACTICEKNAVNRRLRREGIRIKLIVRKGEWIALCQKQGVALEVVLKWAITQFSISYDGKSCGPLEIPEWSETLGWVYP